MTQTQPNLAPKLLVSACLLGQPVRYDGKSKGLKELGWLKRLETEGRLVVICPEVAGGLPTPRPAAERAGERVITTTGFDVTEEFQSGAEQALALCQKHNIRFALLKAKSPSCGMERVKVYHQNADGDVTGSEATGIGMFARQIMEHNPALPCEENGRLNDPLIRENFVLRVFAYNTWLNFNETGLTKHKLIQFHSQYKYLLLSHSQDAYRKLGKFLGTSDLPLEEMAQQYIVDFMTALKQKASRGSHCNTLQHLQGYFSKHLDKSQREELSQSIHEYREGILPLMAPLTLIKHYLNTYPNDYLANQKYLDPYPADLRLRYGY